MKLTKIISTLVVASWGFYGVCGAAAAEAKSDVKLYPLSTCLITGAKLGSMGKPVVKIEGQQEIQFCCQGCVKEYEKNPADFLKKLEAAEKKAAEQHPYLPKTCLVNGEKLGSMGEGYTFVYADQEIKLCCKGCLDAFAKEPAKYLKKLPKTKS